MKTLSRVLGNKKDNKKDNQDDMQESKDPNNDDNNNNSSNNDDGDIDDDSNEGNDDINDHDNDDNEEYSYFKDGDYKIYVNVIEASNLNSENCNGTSNPIVYVTCMGQSRKTRIVSNVTSCVFDCTLTFEFKNKTKEELNEKYIKFEVRNHNTFVGVSDVVTGKFQYRLIGSYSCELSSIYNCKDHELYNQWVCLMDNEDSKDRGIQGYLKVTIQIVGPGENLPYHNVDEEKEKESNSAQGDISSQAISRDMPSLRWMYIKVEVYQCEYFNIPIKKSKFYSKVAYCQLLYGSGKSEFYPKQYSTSPGEDKGVINFDCEVWYPVCTPATVQLIKLGIWRKSGIRGEKKLIAYVEEAIANFEDVKDGVLKWYNLYGFPEIKTKQPLSLSSMGKAIQEKMSSTTSKLDCRKLYNDFPKIAPTWKGRVLLKFSIEKESKPFEKKEYQQKYHQRKSFTLPSGTTGNAFGVKYKRWSIKAQVFMASQIKTQNGRKYTIKLCIGEYSTTPVEATLCKKELCKWGEEKINTKIINLPDIELPQEQKPDLFIYLLEDDTPIYFQRLTTYDVPSEAEKKLLFLEESDGIKLKEYEKKIKEIEKKNIKEIEKAKLTELKNSKEKLEVQKNELIKRKLTEEKKTKWLKLRVNKAYQVDEGYESVKLLVCISADTIKEGDASDETKQNKPLDATTNKGTSDGDVYDVRVCIYQAEYLKAVDFDTKQADPYVKVSFNGQESETSTVKGSLHPAWYETIVFKNVVIYKADNFIYNDMITCRLYDRNDYRSPRFLGSVSLTIDKTSDPEPKWHDVFDIGDKKGEGRVLVKVLLVQGSSKDPPSILPHTKKAVISIEAIGLRELPSPTLSTNKRFLVMKMESFPDKAHHAIRVRDDSDSVSSNRIPDEKCVPSTENYISPKEMKIVDFETVKSRTPSATNPNFFMSFKFDVELPENPIFARPLFLEVKESVGPKIKEVTYHTIGKGVIDLRSRLPWRKSESKASKKEVPLLQSYGSKKWAKDRGEFLSGSKLEDYIGKSDFESFDIKRLTLFGRSVERVGKFKAFVEVVEGDTAVQKNSDSTLRSKFTSENDYRARLYVLEAVNLAQMDYDFLKMQPMNSDPYLKVKFGNKEIHNGVKNYNRDATDVDFYSVFEFDCRLPGIAKLSVEVWDKDTKFDDLIGETVIDLEDRVFNQKWTELGQKPVEHRQLLNNKSSQGELTCWLDIMSIEDANRYPIAKIALPPNETFEVRLVIWTAECRRQDMDYGIGGGDFYVKCWISSQEDCRAQSTDTHWRCQNGKASFNYRILFDVELGHRTRAMRFPRLYLQLWDYDFIKYDDYAGQAVIDLTDIFRKAYEKNVAVNLSKAVNLEELQSNKKKSKRKESQKPDKEEEEEIVSGVNPAFTAINIKDEHDQRGEDKSLPNKEMKDLSLSDEEKKLLKWLKLTYEETYPSKKLFVRDIYEEYKNTKMFMDSNPSTCLNCFRRGEESCISCCSETKFKSLLKSAYEKQGINIYKSERSCCSYICCKNECCFSSDYLEGRAPILQDFADHRDADQYAIEWLTKTLNWNHEPPHSHDCKIYNSSNPKNIVGEIKFSLEVWPKEKAKIMSVGPKREEPNRSPFLPEPTGRIHWRGLMNPCRFIHLIYRLIGWRFCSCFTCCFIFVLIYVGMMYCQPFFDFIFNIVSLDKLEKFNVSVTRQNV